MKKTFFFIFVCTMVFSANHAYSQQVSPEMMKKKQQIISLNTQIDSLSRISGNDKPLDLLPETYYKQVIRIQGDIKMIQKEAAALPVSSYVDMICLWSIIDNDDGYDAFNKNPFVLKALQYITSQTENVLRPREGYALGFVQVAVTKKPLFDYEPEQIALMMTFLPSITDNDIGWSKEEVKQAIKKLKSSNIRYFSENIQKLAWLYIGPDE